MQFNENLNATKMAEIAIFKNESSNTFTTLFLHLVETVL